MSYSGAMTTNELIEKYGIGHNCLSDAYALGMMHGLDGMENAVELAEGKARVDAIDSILELPRHNHYDMCDNLMYQSIKVDDIKKLKEQNNE